MGELSSLLLVSQGISAGASVAGGISQASALRLQGNAAREQENVNARYADLQMRDVLSRGSMAANREIGTREQQASAMRAQLGASGVDVNTGSPAAASNDIRLMGELDALTIRNNATREAMGYQVQSLNDRTRGKMAVIAARNAAAQSIAQGGMNAAGSALKGAYLYDKYKGLGNNGTSNPDAYWTD